MKFVLSICVVITTLLLATSLIVLNESQMTIGDVNQLAYNEDLPDDEIPMELDVFRIGDFIENAAHIINDDEIEFYNIECNYNDVPEWAQDYVVYQYKMQLLFEEQE